MFVPEPMPMICDTSFGVSSHMSSVMTYLIFWPDVPVNCGICGKSLGRFNSVERRYWGGSVGINFVTTKRETYRQPQSMRVRRLREVYTDM